MACEKERTTNCDLASTDKMNHSENHSTKFVPEELEEKGRLQFFFHSPSSRLPVRDVLNEQRKGHKTEPHIEIGAENYSNCCYQSNNIMPFLKSMEKYLFLFTTCKNRELKGSYDKRFIVGYIAKHSQVHFPKTESCKDCKVVEECDGRHAVIGDVKVFRFEDAYPLEFLIPNPRERKNTRVRTVSIDETERILAHFKSRSDVLVECIREIERLDKMNEEENKTCKVLHKETCIFQKNGCLRRDIFMKAMLLRIGIDKGTDGALAPIFDDGSFEYIPISEGDPESEEDRTYGNTIGRSGKPLSTYLPRRIENKTMHFDPEFETFTYGDPTSKRHFLLKLQKGDLLVFYAGLTPFKNARHREGLYVIGYFTVEKIIDFSQLSKSAIEGYSKIYSNNAHIKRSYNTKDLVIVVGHKGKSKLLNRALHISQAKLDKRSRPYYAVSSEMERLLGISGSIHRSIPPRFIKREDSISNLRHLLSLQ